MPSSRSRPRSLRRVHRQPAVPRKTLPTHCLCSAGLDQAGGRGLACEHREDGHRLAGQREQEHQRPLEAGPPERAAALPGSLASSGCCLYALLLSSW